ncbi:aig1 family protein [Stylonychia lemnae]|uniref:Aig1 family protein n=1 Tax=Stylonychia lemnae TaxID=5949 RepID=A0A078A644_STYLE|nr:aig1 family protein [Stylonychia lemnae]|eukprot:CDW77366.1 aig1 family protein [Stylonychia lemnae]
MQIQQRSRADLNDSKIRKNHSLSDQSDILSDYQEFDIDQPQSEKISDYYQIQRNQTAKPSKLDEKQYFGLKEKLALIDFNKLMDDLSIYFSIALRFFLILSVLAILTDCIRDYIIKKRISLELIEAESQVKFQKEYSFVLLGSENSGKSTFGNLLLGFELFDTRKSQQSQSLPAVIINGTLFGEDDGQKIRVIDSQGHENQDQKDFENASKLIYLLKKNPIHNALIYVLEIQNLISENSLNELRLRFYKSAFKDFLKNTIFVVSKWSFHQNHTDQRAKENIDLNEVYQLLQKLLVAVGFENPNPTVYFIDSFYDPEDQLQKGMFNQSFESFWNV